MDDTLCEAFRTYRIGLHVPAMDGGMMTPAFVHHDAWERSTSAAGHLPFSNSYANRALCDS